KLLSLVGGARRPRGSSPAPRAEERVWHAEGLEARRPLRRAAALEPLEVVRGRHRGIEAGLGFQLKCAARIGQHLVRGDVHGARWGVRHWRKADERAEAPRRPAAGKGVHERGITAVRNAGEQAVVKILELRSGGRRLLLPPLL